MSLIRNLQERTAKASMATVARPATTLLLGLIVGSTPGRAADFPRAEISNKQITAWMYLFWSIRTVLAIEPYVSIDIQPGVEFTWKNMYEYYTMPASRQPDEASHSR